MRATSVLVGLVYSWLINGFAFADTDIKQLCRDNLDTHTYVTNVFFDNDCIPSDPCSSADAKVRQKYCINSIDDIDVDWYGTYSLAYSGKYTNEKYACMLQVENHLGAQDGWMPLLNCENAKLKPGEWLVRFPYGTVKGESKCSAQNGLDIGKFAGMTQKEYGLKGKKSWTTDEKKLDSEPGDKQYCWCRANGLYSLMTDTQPKLSFKQNIWMYTQNPGARNCENDCAQYCAQSIFGATTAGRSAMFFGKDERLKEKNETAAQKLCYDNIDKYTYVSENDTCISADPCSSTDAEVQQKYCIKSIQDLLNKMDMRIKGTHTRAYNKSVLGKECNVLGNSVGGSWPVSDCENVGLKYGDWLVRFPYGTIKGTSKCSAVGGDGIDESNYHISRNKVSTRDKNVLDTATGEKRYCWCQANGLYTLMSDITPKTSIKDPVWALGYIYKGAGACNDSCVEECARQFKLDQHLRTKMVFGE